MLHTLTRTDSQIHRHVIDELRWDPRVDETEVGVQVKDGVVTLVGTVDAYAKKEAAQEAAHRVAGVLDVANDIEVKITGAYTRTDSQIAAAVRSALEWDALVPDDKIHSTVTNGWVTLSGTVDRWSQREEAGRAVRRLNGVTGITNTIAVKAPTVDPDRIRRDIEAALDRQAHREAQRIEIDVHDGIVNVSGTVRTFAEKQAILGAAGFAPGVRGIHDGLTVEHFA
jgi:osmotically-inducible protein OsmY